PREVAGLVTRGDADALAGHIEKAMEEAGLSPSAGRLPLEIARRLMEKAELASVRLSDTALDALKAFLAIHVPLEEAEARLADFAEGAGIFLDEALAGFRERAERIARHGLPPAEIHYDAGFGRPLDYYTGFVFEIGTDALDQPLAGGGRYDRLLTLLGAERPIPGVGFSIWLDRVAALRETKP
ncbi:ATP phosphoribosyltransferase regulatory subunit, partial [Nitratireductor sp. GCM10026969]|uniref:ATP phosphoribosyltransferase regulatory subunit n=1 Tax=Nitratireductor sp. GCM10026969 TaxID=3252645 RepID=UPI003617CEE0